MARRSVVIEPALYFIVAALVFTAGINWGIASRAAPINFFALGSASQG